MNNIAAKLREVHWRAGWETDDGARVRRQREREEGADEIERLSAEVEKLRAALDILQAAMTAKKPIPLALKKAIIEARAAITQETRDER